MEYGHIVLARRFHNILSSANCIVTGSYFSHAFSTLSTDSGRLLALEAEAEGVTAAPMENYETDPNRDYVMFSVNIPKEAKDKGLDAVINKLETGYGYAQMPWFIWRWICSKFGKDIKSQDNWFKKDGSLCSQLVAEYIEAADLGYLIKEFGKGSVSPQDIYLIVKANPQLFTECKRKIRYPGDPRL